MKIINARQDVMSFLSVFLILSAALVFSGCGTSGTMATSQVLPNNQVLNRIIINNPFLASKIRIDDLRPSFSGDLLVAHVALTSTHNSALDVQYKIRWFDAQGIEVAPDGAPWQPLTLYGGESKGIEMIAPNPSVKEFKIEIRYTK